MSLPSLDSLPPATTPPRDVVSKKVYIEGTVLENDISLAQITIGKTFNKIAFAKLVLLDGSVSKRDFALSNDQRFKPGNKIKIDLGYHGNVKTVFEGIIVKHGVKIRQKGHSILMIEAKDKAVTLTGSRKSAYHNQKLDSTVWTKLAKEKKLDVTGIEPTTFMHKQLVQMDTTDWDFIVTRAEANGMLVLTDDGKLIIKKPSTASAPVLTATYGLDIWEFEAEMDARRQIKSVTSHSWNFTKQALEDSKEGKTDFLENGNFLIKEIGEVLNGDINLKHAGNLSKPQLDDWSDAYALRNHLSKVSGRVRLQGNADLKPGKLIKLAGVGSRFNGNVFITGVLHHYQGGWQTDVQFGWRDDWFYKKENVMDKPASGLLPGINGLMTGVVLDVDDTEEGGQYRVKVHIPTITTGDEGIWARVATLDAGPNRGSYFRPQKKDEVLLGFLNDDPRDAIILGYLHSKSTNASPLPEEKGKLQYGFVTQEGIKLIFDDSNKRMKLIVPGATGEKSLIINNDASAIEMKDENNNSIKMDSTGITIDAGPTGIVTIKGLQVKIN